ncbi:MAG: hypothetical protein II874_09135 [Bacteroidales bacterium]|nr:hypothetical protein [Bacteroidales bacterium]
MRKRYVKPASTTSIHLVLERRFCAGSDILQDAVLESAGIQTEEYDFSSDTSPFEFSWEETL